MNKFYIEGEEVESGTKLWADGDVQDGVEHGAPVHHGDGDGDGDGHGHGDCYFDRGWSQAQYSCWQCSLWF